MPDSESLALECLSSVKSFTSLEATNSIQRTTSSAHLSNSMLISNSIELVPRGQGATDPGKLPTVPASKIPTDSALGYSTETKTQKPRSISSEAVPECLSFTTIEATNSMQRTTSSAHLTSSMPTSESISIELVPTDPGQIPTVPTSQIPTVPTSQISTDSALGYSTETRTQRPSSGSTSSAPPPPPPPPPPPYYNVSLLFASYVLSPFQATVLPRNALPAQT